MSRHPAGVVAPVSMLVPVVGMGAAWAGLGERPGGWELAGAVAVVTGVLLTGWNRSAVRVPGASAAMGATRTLGP